MKRTLLTIILILAVSQVYGNDENKKSKSLLEYYDIKKINKVIIVNYKSMNHKETPISMNLITDAKVMQKIKEILSHISSKGEIYKMWPPNIPTQQVIILCNQNKYCILRIDNSRLQRPIGGYGMEKEVTELIKILAKTHNMIASPNSDSAVAKPE